MGSGAYHHRQERRGPGLRHNANEDLHRRASVSWLLFNTPARHKKRKGQEPCVACVSVNKDRQDEQTSP
jgi:hypothetical protein